MEHNFKHFIKSGSTWIYHVLHWGHEVPQETLRSTNKVRRTKIQDLYKRINCRKNFPSLGFNIWIILVIIRGNYKSKKVGF